MSQNKSNSHIHSLEVKELDGKFFFCRNDTLIPADGYDSIKLMGDLAYVKRGKVFGVCDSATARVLIPCEMSWISLPQASKKHILYGKGERIGILKLGKTPWCIEPIISGISFSDNTVKVSGEWIWIKPDGTFSPEKPAKCFQFEDPSAYIETNWEYYDGDAPILKFDTNDALKFPADLKPIPELVAALREKAQLAEMSEYNESLEINSPESSIKSIIFFKNDDCGIVACPLWFSGDQATLWRDIHYQNTHCMECQLYSLEGNPVMSFNRAFLFDEFDQLAMLIDDYITNFLHSSYELET